ncbi:MAG: carbohydrate kinase family protein [Candidatus Thorarchaeota archaeon]
MNHEIILEKLQNPPDVRPPVILPDFFVDHFVILDELDSFVESVRALALQGGGNLIGSRHLIRRGGNSVNTASALLNLGVTPTLIVKTDSQGLNLLKSLVSPSLDLGHVNTTGRLSSTVSIEASHRGRRVNVMVSDSGSAADFSFADLTPSDLESIRQASLVALLCLNHDRGAVGLVRDLFTFVRGESSAHTFIDIGDPSGQPDIIPGLIQAMREGLVDTLSMNENEAGWLARTLAPSDDRWRNLVQTPELWPEAALLVAEETGVRVDLHTPRFASTIGDGHVCTVPAFTVTPRVVCGAGDSWNAGNICGILYGLDDRARLTLANAVAALYVSSAEARHPTAQEVSRFLTSGRP